MGGLGLVDDAVGGGDCEGDEGDCEKLRLSGRGGGDDVVDSVHRLSVWRRAGCVKFGWGYLFARRVAGDMNLYPVWGELVWEGVAAVELAENLL